MWRALILTCVVAPFVTAADTVAADLERWPMQGRTAAAEAVRGPDGSVWFSTISGVGRVDAFGRVTRYRVRTGETGDLTPGPDGALYGTLLSDEGVYRRGIVRIAMDGRSSFVRYRGPGLSITALAPGPDGDLWAATEVPPAIIRMTTSGTMTARTRVSEGAQPTAMATGPDGSVGFASGAGVGRVTPDGRLTLVKTGELSDASAITATPDGAVWALPFEGRRLFRLAADGTLTRLAIGVEPQAITTAPDGDVWVSFYGSKRGGVARIGADGQILQLWREPFGTDGPDSIAFDGGGDLWGTAFSEYSLERLDLVPPVGPPGPLEPFLPRAGALRRALVLRAGIDGAMWATTNTGLLRIDATGAQKLFDSGPAAKALDVLPESNGAVWIAFGGRGVARLAPDGSVRRVTTPFRKGARIHTMARGPDGALWLLDDGRTVIRWVPGQRARRVAARLGRRPDLLSIAPGPDRRMWITDQQGAILAMSTRGRVRRYTRGLGRRPEPTAITAGPDGNMWFTMFSRRRIGRITPSGRIRTWRTRESPASISQGPDGAMWFTTAAVSLADTINGLGRIDTRGHIQEFFVRASRSTGFQALATGPDGKLWFLLDRGPLAMARMDPLRLAQIGAIRP